MSDVTTAISNTAENDKRALLSAVASSGSAGRDAYTSAQGAVDPLRQQAMAQAANAANPAMLAAGFQDVQGAHGNGFMGGGNDALSTIQASLGQSRQLQEAETARQAAAGEQYYSQLNAALPFVDQETQAQIRQIAAARAESEADRAFKIKQRDIDTKQLSVTEQKFKNEQDLDAARTQFRSDLTENAGPIVKSAFNAFLGHAKSLDEALANISTTPMTGKDSWESIGIKDPKTIQNLEELITAYFQGQPLPRSVFPGKAKPSDYNFSLRTTPTSSAPSKAF